MRSRYENLNTLMGNGKSEISENLELWNIGTLKLWNFGTLELWNPGTLEPWNFGTLELWNIGTLKPCLHCP
jgi:hypothetical protein